MKCICGSEVPENNRFCGRCGREAQSFLHCEKCGSANPPDHRFCGKCGLRLLAGVTASVTDSNATIRLDQAQLKAENPASVRSEPVQSPEQPTLREVSRADSSSKYQPVYSTAPSLLGLNSTSGSDMDDSYYLLDDNPQRTVSWRAWALVILLGVAGVLGLLEWKSVSTLASSKHNLAALLGPPENQGQTASAPPLPSSSPTPIDVDAQGNHQKKAEEDRQQQGSGTQTSTDSASQSSGSSQSHVKEQDGSGTTGVPPSGKSNGRGSGSDSDNKPESDEGAERPHHPTLSDAANDDQEPNRTASKPAATRSRAEARQSGTDDPLFDKGQLYLRMHNCEQGLIYLRAAAEKPDPRAQVQLGAMYMTGNCVAKDRVAAYRWFSSAQDLEPNNQWVSKNLNMLWQQMTRQEQNRAR